MKIVIDAHIPFIAEAVRTEWPQVDIYPLKPEEIDADAVKEADVLIVRTRTKVNEALLKGSKVQLVCTATIGFDHIDTAYCEANSIRWMSCPGCNAQAVCDYIEEALNEISNLQSPISNTPTIGIVGVGHVGSLVAKMAERRGMKVLLNDPPKHIGVSLDFIAQNSDIITFHVPLDKSTYHICDEAFLAKCKPGALIINAARCGVVDEQALLRSGHPYILDTWENEPDINAEVLQKAALASMHIACYSVEGKRNASHMCLDEIADSFHLPKISNLQSPISNKKGDSAPGWISRISASLKAHPTAFEVLRKSYPLREG
jgi:erythronate-4-phosphate dehydrogenase